MITEANLSLPLVIVVVGRGVLARVSCIPSRNLLFEFFVRQLDHSGQEGKHVVDGTVAEALPIPGIDNSGISCRVVVPGDHMQDGASRQEGSRVVPNRDLRAEPSIGGGRSMATCNPGEARGAQAGEDSLGYGHPWIFVETRRVGGRQASLLPGVLRKRPGPTPGTALAICHGGRRRRDLEYGLWQPRFALTGLFRGRHIVATRCWLVKDLATVARAELNDLQGTESV